MNLTNIKLIWRNLLKNTSITAINIFGLSVSLAVCTLIVLFLQFEYSFDKANPQHENIFRLTTTFKYPNSPERPTAMASAPMGPYLQRASADIEEYLRVLIGNENFLCRANGKEKVIEKSLSVDSSFFSFFNFPLLHGDSKTAFYHLDNILITRPVSEQFYGDENPVGEILEYSYAIDAGRDTTIQYTIAGVFDHLPINSHLQFEALTPLDARYFPDGSPTNSWHGLVGNTYFKLRTSAQDANKVAATFPSLLEKEMPSHDMVGLGLQAFSDIHLDSSTLQYDNNNYQKSDRKYLQVFGLIAFFILLISCINFANLSTVLAMRRVREVGVRKSLGANGSDVLFQFLGEALLMSVIGGMLALAWVVLLREHFMTMLDRTIDMSIGWGTIAMYAVAIVSLGLLAGIFPAVQAARYSAVEAFRRLGTSVSVKRPFIQRLVVLQFTLSGILIIGSMICYKQLNFMQSKELGFQSKQVMELNLGWNNWTRAEAFQKELTSIPGIIDVTGSDVSLGTINGQNGVLIRDEKTKEVTNYSMSINSVAHNYFDLYEMEFAAGGPPTLEGAVSGMQYVVNESFVKRVGWLENPIDKEIMRPGFGDGEMGRVVGVIKDIHHNTLHSPIGSICFQASTFTPILSVKYSGSNLENILPKIENSWNKHVKDRPFDYKFMDAHIAALYDNETRLGQMLLIATFLSILIACLGLLALSTFIIQQRAKEISIRKVLGASTAGIVTLLSKDFLKLVLIAFVLAIPVAWYVMEQWLQDFAYRTNIGWAVFVIAGIGAISIAFLTVSFQSAKAALMNPVNSLKSD